MGFFQGKWGIPDEHVRHSSCVSRDNWGDVIFLSLKILELA